MAKAIMINIERCLACKSCEIACAVVHSRSGVLEKAITEQPRPQTRVSVEATGRFGIPMQCRHCEDAPCITVCPSKAIYRRMVESPVLINADLCIGCKFCLMVCPFGVIYISRDGKAVTKCDFCITRTEAGQEPACVESCPTGALEFCEVQEWVGRRRGATVKKAVGLTETGKNVSRTKGESKKG